MSRADYNRGTLPERARVLQSIAALIAATGALLLIVQWAGGRPLWVDEEMIAINFRDRSFRGLASPLSLGQSAPYLWLVLQRVVVLSFGTGERALRLVPLAFGIGTLASAVWIGRRWMTAVGAAALALLCATGEWLSFHVHELKHYSADACFGMLIPALAAWASEASAASGTDLRRLRQRLFVFWIVAASAQWLANGALLVTPASALMLVCFVAWRSGRRAAVEAMALGMLWAASFALNDVVSLQNARGSRFLQEFWSIGFPPADAGPVGALAWLVGRLTPLAIKPAGSGLGLIFWMAALGGPIFALRRSAVLALSFTAVPFSAFALAAARIVPLFERLSLWMVPALYVGVAFAADGVAALLAGSGGRRAWTVAAGAVGACLLLALCGDVVARGTTYLNLRPQTTNHELDDRDAVRWLIARRRPGDVWLTTYLALPAIWWYDGWDSSTPIFEASFRQSADCASDDVRAALGNSQRALVYLGFRFDDVPKGFDDLLLMRLTEVGAVSASRRFGAAGHAILVDLRDRSRTPLTLADLLPGSVKPAAMPAGCIAARPARAW